MCQYNNNCSTSWFRQTLVGTNASHSSYNFSSFELEDGEWYYEKLTSVPEIFRPEVLETIEEEMNKLSLDLRNLSLKIHGEVLVHALLSLTLIL